MGLNIGLTDFERLPIKQKLNCLYQNQCEQMKIIQSYKLFYKLTSIIGGFLVSGIGIIFGMLINHIGGN